MQLSVPSDPVDHRAQSGFALIASLSIMAVLVLIGVSLFSLSLVATRNAELASAQTEAQANARTALMLAVGELQSELGPDQRITANAAILDAQPETSEIDDIAHPHWLGSWDSWVAGDLSQAVVGSGYPSEPSHHQTLGDGLPDESMHPNYSRKSDHFRSWLISLSPEPKSELSTVRFSGTPGIKEPPSGATSVQLVGSGSLGRLPDESNYVTVGLLEITENGSRPVGRYGWWVGDESQKAAILPESDSPGASLSDADRIFEVQAPSGVGTRVLPGFSTLADPSLIARVQTLRSLDLLEPDPQDTGRSRSLSQLNFHTATSRSFGVFSDVREGGLKRDLSAILERPIDPEDVYSFEQINHGTPTDVFDRATDFQPNGEDFILYRLHGENDTSANGRPLLDQASVPIQDLAAYYQLYDSFRPEWREGVKYSSNILSDAIQVQIPDYGTEFGDNDAFLREYTGLYRNIIPVKMQIMLSYITIERDPSVIQQERDANGPDFEPDTHALKVGLTPAVTLWNPNNVPMSLNNDDEDKFPYMFRPFELVPTNLEFIKNEGEDDEIVSEQMRLGSFTASVGTQGGELFSMYLGATEPIYLEPGETKVVSFAFTSDKGGPTNIINFSKGDDSFQPRMEGFLGWDPTKFVIADASPEVLTFKSGDNISARLLSSVVGTDRRYNNNMKIRMIQKSRQSREAGDPTAWTYTHWGVETRQTRGTTGGPFAQSILDLALPQPDTDIIIPSRSADSLIGLMGNDLSDPTDDTPSPFLYVGLKAAVETHEDKNGGLAGGRKFTSRPFLHSSTIPATFLGVVTGRSLYDVGWNWWIEPVNSFFELPVEITAENQGFYGAGYSAEYGTTHIVQRHLPLVPPISIASLSHAHLGGFSLATEPPVENFQAASYRDTSFDNYQRVTAAGYAGLGPHTLQAIGNSYAHPFIEADKTFTDWAHYYLQLQHNNPTKVVRPFADHSYLANKALWDDYFFSSITPKPEDVVLFGNDAGQDVEQVARRFFFEQGRLPNRRMRVNADGMTEARLDELLSEYGFYADGFADKIAAYLVIEGPFNINSTSVDAWKAVLSSLKDKAVAYLDKDSPGTTLEVESNISGVPIAGGDTPNSGSYTGSPTDPVDDDQWTGWRVLTETEIEELAEAIVRQVKTRGPFLSLSEFINRRLDADEPELSVKGALQAAIDDPNVSINEGFRRSDEREFSSSEISFVSDLDNVEGLFIPEDPGGPAFPDALEGPVAYGSSAYVDQADLLRHFGAQLTPRGDTFVVRAYGDTLDENGEVIARAWCEAVVQRTPNYLSPVDEDHLAVAELSSETNRRFGRKLKILEFRWLKKDEI